LGLKETFQVCQDGSDYFLGRADIVGSFLRFYTQLVAVIAKFSILPQSLDDLAEVGRKNSRLDELL